MSFGIVNFPIYSSSRFKGEQQIDYENVLAKINYKGRKFYNYQSSPLELGRYLFAIITEDTFGNENSSSAHLTIELKGDNPNPVTILQAKTI